MQKKLNVYGNAQTQKTAPRRNRSGASNPTVNATTSANTNSAVDVKTKETFDNSNPYARALDHRDAVNQELGHWEAVNGLVLYEKYPHRAADDTDKGVTRLRIRGSEHINQPEHANQDRFDPMFSDETDTEREHKVQDERNAILREALDI